MKLPEAVSWFHILLIPVIEVVSYISTGDYLRNYVGYYAPFLVFLLASCSALSGLDIVFISIILLYGFLFEAENRFFHVGYVISILQLYFVSTKLPKAVKQVRISKWTGFVLLSLNLMLLFAFAMTSSDHYEGGRYYKSCFVIPHEMAYYLAMLIYVNICFGNWWIAVPNFFVIAMIGTRVGIILGGLAVIASGYKYMATNKGRIGKKVLVVGGIAIGLVAFVFLGVSSELMTAIDAIFSTKLNFDLYDSETIQGSSHRALLATTSFEKAISDGISVENIFGRGPRWTMLFNEAELGVRIWSHNDLLDLFMCGGVALPVIYLYAVYRLFLETRSLYIIGFVFVAGILNGFFFYPTPFLIGIFLLTLLNRPAEDCSYSDLRNRKTVPQFLN